MLSENLIVTISLHNTKFWSWYWSTTHYTTCIQKKKKKENWIMCFLFFSSYSSRDISQVHLISNLCHGRSSMYLCHWVTCAPKYQHNLMEESRSILEKMRPWMLISAFACTFPYISVKSYILCKNKGVASLTQLLKVGSQGFCEYEN